MLSYSAAKVKSNFSLFLSVLRQVLIEPVEVRDGGTRGVHSITGVNITAAIVCSAPETRCQRRARLLRCAVQQRQQLKHCSKFAPQRHFVTPCCFSLAHSLLTHTYSSSQFVRQATPHTIFPSSDTLDFRSSEQNLCVGLLDQQEFLQFLRARACMMMICPVVHLCESSQGGL